MRTVNTARSTTRPRINGARMRRPSAERYARSGSHPPRTSGTAKPRGNCSAAQSAPKARMATNSTNSRINRARVVDVCAEPPVRVEEQPRRIVRRHGPDKHQQPEKKWNPPLFLADQLDEEVLCLRCRPQDEKPQGHERQRNAHDPEDQREIE